MLFKTFAGYIEGQDISTIPESYLTYPSKNVIIKKGKAFSRPGIKNDGVAPTGTHKIIGEKVWRDALAGGLPLRVTQDGRLQLKWNSKWVTIYSGISGSAVRVRFDTWVDDLGAIIKKRLFFVDGTDAVYEWNGAIGTIASVNASGHSATISGSKTLQQLGFDPGTPAITIGSISSSVITATGAFSANLVTGQPLTYTGSGGSLTNGQTYYMIPLTTTTFKVAGTAALAVAGTAAPLVGSETGSFSYAPPVQIVRYSGGVPQTPDAYTTDSDMPSETIHMTGAFSNTPAMGDLVMGAVIKHTDVLTGFNKDDICTYKNHVGVANLNAIQVYFSDAEAKLDFTIPASGSRTALSAFQANLDGNYTAMIGRFDASIKETVLWISSVNDWLKIIALDAADSNGEWVETEQIADAERTGALPFSVTQHKGDIIFLAQDLSLQRIQTIDVLAKDTFTLLSDEVEDLLTRLNSSEVRLYYLKRYIYILFPASGTIVTFDVVGATGSRRGPFPRSSSPSSAASCMGTATSEMKRSRCSPAATTSMPR